MFQIFKLGLFFMLFGFIALHADGQSLPATFDMSTGNSYTLTNYSQANIAFPPNMVIRFCGDCNAAGNFTTDLTAEADHRPGGGAGKWRGENALGVSVRGGTNQTRGSFLMILNTTSRSQISVSWTVRDIVPNPNTNYIELQWRIGGSGAWNNVTNDLYQQGTTASGTMFNVVLPSGADNQSDLRVRWIYYANGNGAMDRLAIDDITISSSGVLPLQITDFYLQNLSPRTKIIWNSSTTENIEYFAVEHSIDGFNFSECCLVFIDPSKVQSEYSCINEKQINKVAYYRVKQVDFDGSIFYTDIKSIKIDDHKIKLYPSVATSTIWLDTDQLHQATVYNLHGQPVITTQIDSKHPLDVTSFPVGNYILVLFDQNNHYTFKFSKI